MAMATGEHLEPGIAVIKTRRELTVDSKKQSIVDHTNAIAAITPVYAVSGDLCENDTDTR